MKEVLKGIRVLDFTRVLAGPYATRILADAGAEVIKVQSGKTAHGVESNSEGYFNTWNRNKKSITLNMDFPEAGDLVLKLTALSDVVVENFSPRVMLNWGLTFEKLREARVDLIMLSMSGMGRNGPWKDFVAYAPTIHSLSGMTYLSSETKDLPLGPGYAHADMVAGLYGALSVLAALEYRDRTGEGQYIDLSELEAMCTAIGPALLEAFANQINILPSCNRAPYRPAAPHGCYRCKGEERWCVIAVFNETEWRALCKVAGKEEWVEDPRYATIAGRMEHAPELDQAIEGWTSKQDAEQLVNLLQEQGIAAGVVQNAQDLAGDPHLKARDFFVHLEHPVLGETISDASPIKCKGSSREKWKSAPLLGADNGYVFLELLGLKEDELNAFIERGIIG
ncbi:CaiB/BaiF CoA transferase family protein [Thermodesulfobacteriota bacterium]